MDPKMISFDQAIEILDLNLKTIVEDWPTHSCALTESCGLISAENIHAPFSLPRFNQSAMDGFAVRSQDTQNIERDGPKSFKVIHTSYAGEAPTTLPAGTNAIKIMTGAPIPKNANAVVKVEDCVVSMDCVTINKSVPRMTNIRTAASEIMEGNVILRQGMRIHPGTIAALSGFGRSRLTCFKRPAVSAIVTGDEIIADNEELTTGKIFDSNRPFLSAALAMENVTIMGTYHAADAKKELKKTVIEAAEESDVVVLTGGVSVGEHDYTKAILNEIGVRDWFWGVAQKPGKPIYIGSKDHRIFLGLPGNPYAVFFTYWFYVRRVIRSLLRFKHPGLSATRACLEGARIDAKDRDLFLKALVIGEAQSRARLLPRQGSHELTPLTEMNAFVRVKAKERVQAGDVVVLYPLPHGELSEMK